MSKKVFPFKGTKEQEEQLNVLIKEHVGDSGALMPVLQGAQNIYGYLPLEVQRVVARGLNMPLSEVYGVVTFYAQFSLTPKGKHKIAVCLGTACYVKGAGDIFNRIKKNLGLDGNEDLTEDGLFSVDGCRCIGACGLAPLITVDEDVYGKITADDVDGILEKYKKAE
ncbi:MAG: NAD(P)H-dependent oxidoreductase subunit E [Defluviitaleaceae bacterium]|nr:NAD(P)H-dependent oxidoreductase subunit E [Defluviitaleaceae bacterium]